MAWESVTSWPHRILATSPPRPDVALTPEATGVPYDFESFMFGFVQMRDAGFWVSLKFFDRWQVIGNLWIPGLGAQNRPVLDGDRRPSPHPPSNCCASSPSGSGGASFPRLDVVDAPGPIDRGGFRP